MGQNNEGKKNKLLGIALELKGDTWEAFNLRHGKNVGNV